MLSAAGNGNVEVAATAVGFTTMFFIIVALAAALFLGYGRNAGRSGRAPGRGPTAPRYDRPAYAERAAYADPPVYPETALLGQDQPQGPEPRRGPERASEPRRGPERAPAPGRGPQAGRPEGPARNQEPPQPSNFRGGGKFGRNLRSDRITVEVNPQKCARFGFCEHEAPSVFYLQSDGRFGYQASVPVEKMEQVISAMDVCPRRAIKVKLPKAQAEARVRPEEPPDDGRRIIPIFGQRTPEEEGRAPRRP